MTQTYFLVVGVKDDDTARFSLTRDEVFAIGEKIKEAFPELEYTREAL